VFPTTVTFTDGTQAANLEEPTPINLGTHTLDDVVDFAVDTSKRLKRPNHG
jgi:hypothetical protein